MLYPLIKKKFKLSDFSIAGLHRFFFDTAMLKNYFETTLVVQQGPKPLKINIHGVL